MKEIKELIIDKPLEITGSIATLPQMLFREIPGREGSDDVLKGHLGKNVITLTLEELRSLVLFLQPYFEERQINKGSTVLLISLPGTTEIMTAIYFIALACRGVRVCMPMQCSQKELGDWIIQTEASHAIIPTMEINDLEGHDLGKNQLLAYKEILNQYLVRTLDNVSSFPLYHALISNAYHTLDHGSWEKELGHISPFDEAVIVATSGSTGRSRLVVYDHNAFALGCIAWNQAGLFEDDKMGGSSFTPMVAHTMGIRGIMNAIWTGKPACLINPDLFFTEPATAIEILKEMSPKVITGGPGVFKIFTEILKAFPEAYESILSRDKVLVNCGATLDRELERSLHHKVWNAFGTTETMMAMTTMLEPHATQGSLGAPLPGVSVKLVEYDKEQHLYTMHIRSAFGCTRILGQDPTTGYINTGDLVRMASNGDIIHAGRVRADIMKDDFGVKVPMMVLYDYYHEVIEHSLHCEWYTLNGYPGTCILVFTDEDGTERLKEMMDRANQRMMEEADPLSFAHWHLARIGIVHQAPPLSGKGTVSTKRINEEWGDFIALVRNREATSIDILSSFTDQLSEEQFSTS